MIDFPGFFFFLLLGFEKFRSVTSSYYRGANGILLVFDSTAPATFNNLRDWHADCQKFTSNCAYILVGNKSDDKAEVSAEEGTIFYFTLSSQLPI